MSQNLNIVNFKGLIQTYSEHSTRISRSPAVRQRFASPSGGTSLIYSLHISGHGVLVKGVSDGEVSLAIKT